MQRLILFFVFFGILIAAIVSSFPKFCADMFGYPITPKENISVDRKKFVTLGTGGVTGLYFPTGGTICRLINRDKDKHKIQCSVESTGGSVYNLNALNQKELDLGIAQSDLIYDAYKEAGHIKSVTPNPNLRTIISLYTEPLTIVARQDSNIKTFADLKGKRVNIGAPGSGQRATMMSLIDYLGWSLKDFKQLSGLNPVEQATALCDNKLDAIVYSVGHPNGSIQEASSSCDANLVQISGPDIDRFLQKNPFYVPAKIKGGMYRGTEDEISTFGVKVGVLATTKLSDDIAYEIVKSIANNFESFKRLHPIFSDLTLNAMANEAIIAPLHDGAAKFFQEKGILK